MMDGKADGPAWEIFQDFERRETAQPRPEPHSAVAYTCQTLETMKLLEPLLRRRDDLQRRLDEILVSVIPEFKARSSEALAALATTVHMRATLDVKSMELQALTERNEFIQAQNNRLARSTD